MSTKEKLLAMKKKEAFSFIKEKLLSDDSWFLRSIVAIFKNQTPDEQNSENTYFLNGIGFNGADAKLMSSFAKQIMDHGSLSFKQREIARKKMPKYVRQLYQISTEKK